MGSQTTATPSTSQVVDLDAYPTAKLLYKRCLDFFNEIENLTPGHILESELNKHYGPGNPFYEDFCTYIRRGLNEGWVANIPLDGPKYRRSKICLPSPETRYLSITTAYLDSLDPYRGQYHVHPYGEINCVVPITEGGELQGMQGWQGAGWTSPAAGTHHYPAVRGGAVVALFFLPAGRISYQKNPDDEQPPYV